MTMSGRQIAIIVAVAFFVGAATGRFAAPTKKQVIVQTQQTQQLEDHSVIQKTETKKPDGSAIIVTITKKDIGEQKQDSTRSEKLVERDSTHLIFSVMGSVNPLQGLRGSPTWGGQVQGRILGPIWVGGWALANGQLGASLGVSF